MDEDTQAGRKPDLVCIGAQKAATTWFHQVMGRRRDIWVPPFKEVHFFDHKFCPENRIWAEANLIKGLKQAEARHLENQPVANPAYLAYLARLAAKPNFNGTWYRDVFSRTPEGCKALDVTPEYSCLPEDGVDFVARFLPEARFVYILRDPVARALSQLRMNLARRRLDPQTDAAWLAVAREEVIDNRGDYIRYVPRWQARFGPDRLLFLPFGDVARDPIGLMRQIEAFAGLGEEAPRGLEKVIFKGKPVVVPQIVIDDFEARFADQRAFLRDHFGAEFAARL